MQCCPPPGEKPGKRDQVEAMFDAIAPRYDLINRVLSLGTDRGWRRAAVRALGRDFQGSILDVATGTGDMVFEALRLNPSRIVGVDISEKMLQLACAKCERSGAGSRVSFVNADAAALPFESGTFDAAMVAFGVRNFQGHHAGAAGDLSCAASWRAPGGFGFQPPGEWSDPVGVCRLQPVCVAPGGSAAFAC